MVKFFAAAALFALASCQTVQGDFCATAKPIRLADAAIDALSDAEAARILEHNRLGQRLCGWKPRGF